MKQKNRTGLILALTFFTITLAWYFLRGEYGQVLAATNNLSAAYLSDGEILKTSDIPLSARQYYVCGILEVEEPIFFQIDVFNAFDKWVGQSNLQDVIQPGEFCVEIVPVGSALSKGTYNVEILYFHDVIGATEFTVGD